MSKVRVFVNGVPLDAPSGTSALTALAQVDRPEAEAVAAGTRMITDSRGIAVPPGTEVFAGAIFRTVRAKPRAADSDE